MTLNRELMNQINQIADKENKYSSPVKAQLFEDEEKIEYLMSTPYKW